MVRTCEVALPVPLRTAFTYRIPDAFDAASLIGYRVLVPFRNRAMLGVVLACGETSEGAALKSVTEVIDAVPSLSPGLIELGRWISNYYLSPIGETFRAMLPPRVEVQFEREWHISDTGREQLSRIRNLTNPSETECADYSLLNLLERRGGVASEQALDTLLPGNSALRARLLRRNELYVREVGRHRNARLPKIVTWNEEAAPSQSRPTEQRVYQLLQSLPGTVLLPQISEAAGVSRSVIERLLKERKLQLRDAPLHDHADWITEGP